MRFDARPALGALCLIVAAVGCQGGDAGDGDPNDGAMTGADGAGDEDDGAGDDASTGADVGPPGTIGPSDDLLVPNSDVTCADGFPVQINASFPQPFTGTGSPSCTLLTYNDVQPTTPGVAVSANIGVGPVTGRMRFVRMRILEQAGVGTACCSAEQFGDEFTPLANGITTVPLDFVIEQGTDEETEIRFADWIGLEVLEPDVPIPGVWTNNGGADLMLPDYLWLPSLSSRGPAPSQNLRSEGSYSGFVPTFNVSFAPAQ